MVNNDYFSLLDLISIYVDKRIECEKTSPNDPKVVIDTNKAYGDVCAKINEVIRKREKD